MPFVGVFQTSKSLYEGPFHKSVSEGYIQWSLLGSNFIIYGHVTQGGPVTVLN